MEQTLEAQVEKRLAELPEDVRAAVLGADLDKQVQEIGTKYRLHIDQAGALGDEVLLAMLGFTELESLPASLAEQVHIAPDVAQKIAQDVSEKLFLPIRESMKKFQESRAAQAELPETKSLAQGLPVEAGLDNRRTEDPRGLFVKEAPPKQSVATSISPAEEKLLPAAEKMLTERTVYKNDPYREPVE